MARVKGAGAHRQQPAPADAASPAKRKSAASAKAALPDPAELSQAQVAERLGLSTRPIRNLHEGGVPHELRDGRPVYPWPEADEWYIRYRIELESKKGDAGGEKKGKFWDVKTRRDELAPRRDEIDFYKEVGRSSRLTTSNASCSSRSSASARSCARSRRSGPPRSRRR